MGIPVLTFTVSGHKISAREGFDSVLVSFQSSLPYKLFECRATRVGSAHGLGVGTLVASFSATPADTVRTFDVYDDFLSHGDGEYRVDLYAQGEDGAWSGTIAWADANSLWHTWGGAKPLTWGEAARGGTE